MRTKSNELTVKITYRRTSRLSMRISSKLELLVSAPYGIPKHTVEEFILKNEAWIKRAMANRAKAAEQSGNFFDRLPLETRKQKTEANLRLQKKVMPMVEKYAAAMGVKIPLITFRATTSKWGSYNKARNYICFSTYLLLLSDFCIEHVVVHELAHIKEQNHGPRFYAILDRFFPQWKEAKLETKRIVRTAAPE